ncbi:MAG: nucleoid-structuring protein H-NS [Omnitrophica bacterium RIFCSPLOWO2_12_FULL_44_17]|uniref:Nucleoid-structuring protein H-NS n=1 Tax=Candidatus Danuiimicrobium aquiferis TaxID=1801832 RepID=A0A1G1KW14_9BACT|nr:MAG: nucleoid-structuring protein H-NS [Omnitrophica bacterium RIFCSPHIGHO2_02_FULL_45_28]OGW88866.1 MAG: nucleoid-structuring protein H-NS [Omnitrophica bacterium RIFCSPHIGHO2_12_FULL_44_12]OGW97128.1 MAG: nucleoid-structuring protein H-NS [Omnitrophica bacterium RIFCSPLOWO2_12_FULL_44_17]OGX03881.1 MAG: nucleoid-structuring protein H-NS [Omnitrophica bacterium RIFCSPLOWO2_02_FULL_44_11]
MYREKIKVLDCTIRDGGLINDHDFTFEFVRNVYRALSEAGVDYMEIGYRNSKKMFPDDKFGPWKFCDDDIVNRVIEGIESKTKISVMADVGRVDMDDVKPKKESPISMVRVATYIKEVDKAIAMVNEFSEKGYETTVNIMAISKALDVELNEALHQLEEECKANVIYIVDSFGALYQETIEYLVKKAKKIIKTKEIGIHNHNNQQLAFSNTIEAIIHGANYLDATVYGIGRGAGNCPIELLLGFLKNPKFDIRPILDVIQKEFLPLQKKIEWGYIIPYAITGMFDEHPRTAIAVRGSDKKDHYREFYDSIATSQDGLSDV